MNQSERNPGSVPKSRPENPNGSWQEKAAQQKLANLYQLLAKHGRCNDQLLHQAVQQLLENGSQPSRSLGKWTR